jgi:hypothetical protein
MERPVRREIDDGSDFFASWWLATDIVLIETIARDGVRLEAKHGLRTARRARPLSHRRPILS